MAERNVILAEVEATRKDLFESLNALLGKPGNEEAKANLVFAIDLTTKTLDRLDPSRIDRILKPYR